ncbi:hypothetical protein [Sphingomonas solaris]|uniref:Uncharacterized protein n=1 Tax=Alterirhizorhabdus solaris TaxID=2529389 RepID=A0A558R5U4_9SPHN|nr:hypothetical protein [Sphingomonas solaris]TVV74749.1 hypothetical protein FOY91_08845 [Sphingomonas solaris]
MGDYNAERLKLATELGVDIAHGVIQSVHAGKRNRPGEAIARRLALHGSIEPNCFAHGVLLPRRASEQLTDIAALVRLYEAQLLPEQVDLLTNTTLRFGDEVPTHRAWMLATNFAYEALCERRSLACIAIFHVPALAGRAAPNHAHLLAICRTLSTQATFGRFSDLTKPGAKAVLATEWAAYLDAHDGRG